jgi:hypothetical protein
VLVFNLQTYVKAQSSTITLFSDGFETGDFSSWTGTTGLGTHHETITNQALDGEYSANFTTANTNNNDMSCAYKNGLSSTDSMDVQCLVNFEGTADSMPRLGVGAFKINEVWDGGSNAALYAIGFDSSGRMCWGVYTTTDDGSVWQINWGAQIPNSQNGFFPTYTTFAFDFKVTKTQVSLYVNNSLAEQVQTSIFASSTTMNAYIGTIHNYAATSDTNLANMIVDDVLITEPAPPAPTPTPTPTPLPTTPPPTPTPTSTPQASTTGQILQQILQPLFRIPFLFPTNQSSSSKNSSPSPSPGASSSSPEPSTSNPPFSSAIIFAITAIIIIVIATTAVLFYKRKGHNKRA